MQTEFVQMICQVGIFVICAQAILQFRPKASYEKYIKLLVSAMMVLQIFLFVGDIFSPESGQKLAERTRWFADNLEESVKKAAGDAFFSREDMEILSQGEEAGKPMGGASSADCVPEISIQIRGIEPVWVGEME